MHFRARLTAVTNSNVFAISSNLTYINYQKFRTLEFWIQILRTHKDAGKSTYLPPLSEIENVRNFL